MTASSQRWWFFGIFAGFLALGVACTPLVVLATIESPDDAPAADYDCGTLSLYTILRIEGRSIGLVDLDAVLPPAGSGGHTLKELRDAASSLGLRLTGVQLLRGEGLDRPALVYTRRIPHGHYMVIRPIGHTGKLAQVIDPARGPYVVDMADLVRSTEWTGFALFPSRPNWLARVGWCIFSIGAVCWLALRIPASFRRRSRVF